MIPATESAKGHRAPSILGVAFRNDKRARPWARCVDRVNIHAPCLGLSMMGFRCRNKAISAAWPKACIPSLPSLDAPLRLRNGWPLPSRLHFHALPACHSPHALPLLQISWVVDSSGTAPSHATRANLYTSVAFCCRASLNFSGDTIEALLGTYPDERIDLGGKDLIIQSTGGKGLTVLVAAPQQVGLHVSIPSAISRETIAAASKLHFPCGRRHRRPWNLQRRARWWQSHCAQIRKNGQRLNKREPLPSSALPMVSRFMGRVDAIGTQVYSLISTHDFVDTDLRNIRFPNGSFMQRTPISPCKAELPPTPWELRMVSPCSSPAATHPFKIQNCLMAARTPPLVSPPAAGRFMLSMAYLA
ncbi:MAG: hypothetical protein ACI87O_000810 [Planctomycetota bacterium]|jgi:hypothetical protein